MLQGCKLDWLQELFYCWLIQYAIILFQVLSTSELLIDQIKALLNSPLCLILAYVSPSRLNAWHTALINGAGVCDAQLEEHLPSNESAIEHFWLDFLEYLLSELRHLLNEFGPQTGILDRLHVLEVSLFFSGPHDSVAVPILEEVGYETADAIFLLNRI